jgi:hypothetical protein
MAGSPALPIVEPMSASMLLAFELYKARYDDLLRQAEESRLGRRGRKARSSRPACDAEAAAPDWSGPARAA